MPEFTKASFGRIAHVQKIEICRFALGSALHLHERQEAKKVFQREHHICEAASRLDLRNQSANCKNVLCSRESVADSIDRTPAKLSPAKRRRIQMFKKKHTMRSGLFVTIDEKGDTCVNSEVHSTVVI